MCETPVKIENLGKHVRKMHPETAMNLEQRLTVTEKRELLKSSAMSRKTHRPKGNRRLLVTSLVILIVIILGYVVVANLPRPRLSTDHSYFDLGQVPQTKVSHTFTFSNSGNGDLIIDRVWTSCGCTTAKLMINGISSPEFGMPGHGGYEGPWEATLGPDEKALLIVYYDAPSMPDIYNGERYVFIDSNDPSQPEFKFTIKVEEIP